MRSFALFLAIMLVTFALGCDPIYQRSIPIDARGNGEPPYDEARVLAAVDGVAARWGSLPPTSRSHARVAEGKHCASTTFGIRPTNGATPTTH